MKQEAKMTALLRSSAVRAPARRRIRRLASATIGVLVAALVVAGNPARAQDDAALWERLRSEPRLVIAMRHTEAARGNPLHFDETGGCSGEAILTSKGRSEAEAVGRLFATRRISPTVISSPMCRCRETAELAFGSRGVSEPALREIASAGGQRFQDSLSTASALLQRHAGGTPIVFISHMPNIDALSGEQIGYGVGLVGRVSPQGDIEPIGRIRLY